MAALENVRQFSKVLTMKKLKNIFEIYLSYQTSKYAKKSNIKGLPFSISIEPTTSCNLRCPECPSGLRSFTRPTGMLQNDMLKHIIDELEDYLVYLNFYFQGEPYLNKNFLEYVAYASKKNIYTSTSTNAHYLNEKTAIDTVKSGLNRLIISIDGTSQETYQQYRIGGNLEKVVIGTQNIIEAKKQLKSKTPHTVFQFLVVQPNQHQVNEVKQLASKLGVDEVKFKTAQIYDYENGNPLIPTIDKYSRYKKMNDGKYYLKNKFYDECWRMWHSCVVTWDGKIVPCCFDKDASHTLGNLKNKSFRDIWLSNDYQNFRNAILTNRSEIDICKNCTEGTKVWA